MSGPAEAPARTRIVSSEHLAADSVAELSEFEYGLIIAQNAFTRWTLRCMAAAGYADLGALDILVLHSVNHRDRHKRAADICFVLNVEDTHTVTYSLRKLEKLGLVDRSRRGKETFFAASARGRAACTRYREIRETCLVASFSALGLEADALGGLARELRAISGFYDQAARAAASL
ncbi:MAG: winged helix DNA-binding protein [Hyphomicrobiales bacterium]|nr:winged helix DNA-binding protein [Hyphomicrobiales bacterium]MCP5371195.1 winged helix DNA-binding protein [Hyphomicrobiales bacterium]